MKRILIIKMSSLGDIIHAFPVLQYIKQYDPQIEIDWIVEKPFSELVQAHPLVNHVITLQTKKWRSEVWKKSTWQKMAYFRRELRKTSYDIVLDLQGNVKSGLVTAFARSPLKIGFGYASVPEWPNILTTHKHYNPPKGQNIREDYLFIVKNALNHFSFFNDTGVQLKLTSQEERQLKNLMEHDQFIKNFKILVCSGSNWPNKQLSKETLQSFLQCISKQLNVHFLLIWGHHDEKIIADELAAAVPLQSSVIPKLSLPVLQNLMRQVDVVIAMDSLPLHLAGTTSTPTYSVFGASSANKYKPIGEQHQAFQGQCPYNQRFEKRCHILRTCKTGACMKKLEGQQLFDDFFKWWSSIRTVSK